MYHQFGSSVDAYKYFLWKLEYTKKSYIDPKYTLFTW